MATYTLDPRVLSGESTVSGFDFYQGGEFHDQATNRVLGTYTITTGTITTVTNTPQGLDSGVLVLQLFFADQNTGHGHGGGQHPPSRQCPVEMMRLEGAPDFVGNPPTAQLPPAQSVQGRQIARACGSVSAATPAFAANINKQWTMTGNTVNIP